MPCEQKLFAIYLLCNFKQFFPFPFSGFHRYVVLVYKQRGFLTPPRKYTDDDREPFNVQRLAQQYNLELVAGNYWLSQYDGSY